jgi:predicted sugar kinase
MMRRERLVGVGQSSWGPTLYGFCGEPSDTHSGIAERLRAELGLADDCVLWTRANVGGARMSV